MIRVFLLAVLGLAALAFLSHHLPDYLRATPDRQVTWEADAAPLARWEGVWSGSYSTYRADGTQVASTTARHEYRRQDDRRLAVTIVDQPDSGGELTTRGELTFDGSMLASRLTHPDGAGVVMQGRRVGDTVFWHRLDPVRGEEETLRERIVSTPDGDVLTVDGVVVSIKDGRGLMLSEGRYRRVDRMLE